MNKRKFNVNQEQTEEPQNENKTTFETDNQEPETQPYLRK